ncbi:MAG TPA: efflux RND transporter periplasmic adaptor subunit [Usitatibacteraceae bacterium]
MALLTLALIVGSLVAVRASSAKKEDKKPNASKVFEFTDADIARLSPREFGQNIPVSGSVRPVVQAMVRSKVPGEVSRVLVREGERVKAGDALITLDTRDLQAQLDSALGSVAEARARLDLARKNEENNKQLLAKGFISQNAFDSVANSVSVTAANVLTAEGQAAIARKALSDATIRAPFNGIIAKRAVNIGEKVSNDSPVAQIVDLSLMELEALVPVSEIPAVRIGQEIAFRVDGFGSRTFKGKVERINPSADAGSRAISVFVSIANADGALKGGMFANGVLAAASKGSVNALPSVAVQEEGGQNFVYIVRDGKVDRRPVTIGVRNVEQGMVEIRDGLDGGVDVVAVRADGIKTGDQAIMRTGAALKSAKTVAKDS